MKSKLARAWRSVFPARLAFLVLAALATMTAQAQPQPPPQVPPPPDRASPALPSVAIQAEGIENFYRLTEHVYSGSAPEGKAAFARLQSLGIRTVISVDGSRPGVELAHEYGLRYVHLPHGYDGIDAGTQAKLIRAAAASVGPIFVHCHHGKHRGPAAAAIVCQGLEGWDVATSDAWLHTAGTSSEYAGLFAAVRDFQPPSAESLGAIPVDLPEVAEVPGLVDAMVRIDAAWDRLKVIRQAGYRAPAAHPGLDPANEAVMLWEQFREAGRLKESVDRGEPFLEQLRAAETRAQGVVGLMGRFSTTTQPGARAQLDQSLDQLAQSCAACHRSFRDTPSPASHPAPESR